MKVHLAICIAKDKKALQKAFVAIENKVNLEQYNFTYLEDSI